MTDYIKFDDGDAILPLKDMFDYKVFHRNHDSGDLELDCNILWEYNTQFYEDLINNPTWFVELSKKCIKETLELFPEKRDNKGNLIEVSTLPKNILNFKIINLKNKIDISQIRHNNLNKLFSLHGIIKRATRILPRTTSIIFECLSCGSLTTKKQDARKKEEPKKCLGCGRNGNLRVLNEKTFDIQELNLEELPEEVGGNQPKQIRVYLEGDLTDNSLSGKLQPGKKIEVIGVIKKLPPFMSKNDLTENISDFMIFAINIISLEEDEDFVFDEEDLKQIQEISVNEPLKKLADSLVPEVWGNQEIKEAIILQLVKGVAKERSDGSLTREDIHLLLSGDPGCISGDSYITLADGTFKKISRVGNKHLQKINMNVLIDKRNPKEPPHEEADCFFKYKNQKTKKIKTETGKEIICNYNHPLFVKKRNEGKTTYIWVRADQLKVGDKIKVLNKTPSYKKSYETILYKGQKILCDEDIGLLWGMLVGDGSSGKYKIGLYLCEDERELCNIAKKIINKKFNLKPRLSIRELKKPSFLEGRQINRTKNTISLEVDSINLSKTLKIEKSPIRRVPEVIMASKNSVISKFLSGLFETDGCCFMVKTKNRKPKVFIKLKSRSHPLLLETQLLLTRFGIKSRIIGDDIFIRRKEDVLSFYKNINFISKDKRKKLKECIKKIKYNGNKKKVYEKIKIIEEWKIQTVYDIHIQNKHRFISNGIISHNTAKSVTLKSVTKKTPKARMVVGTKTSKVGLGAMAVKDELSGTWSLECGNLVLANNSILCVDELDKLYKENLSELLEPMSSGCYDKKTEILTKNGWKFFKDLKRGEKVACLEKGSLKYRKPTTYVNKEYAGEMIKIKSHNIDLLVTPNHNIYSSLHIWDKDWKPYNLRKAEDVYKKLQRFKKTARWFGKEQKTFFLPSIKKYLNHTLKTINIPPQKIDMCVWIEFLGYYLSEGSYNIHYKNRTPYRIFITQNKKKKVVKKIKKCLEKLGFKFSYTKGNFTINSKQLTSYLSQFGRAREKFIPQFIKQLNKKQISIFLEALMLGDGCTRMAGRNGNSIQRDYITSSKKLADDVQELLLKIGIYGHISKRMPKTNKIKGRVIKSKGLSYNVHWIINKNKKKCTAMKHHFSRRFYKGKIYCVEVPKHILYVRRNGIPIWCGNTVSIAKAGINAKLPARTSILASANPIKGVYDPTQNIATQIDLPSPILNRFDLIFVMLDKPNPEFDAKSVEHVFESLTEKREPEIPLNLFKKYIFYCRKLKPQLKLELKEELQKFYVTLRQRSNIEKERGLPINLRNMEGLIRLSEAHAKIRLSEWVEEQDFQVARRIFMYCLKQVGIDNETGMIDISRTTQKVPISKRGKMENVLNILEDLSERFGKEVPYEEIEMKAEEINIKKWELHNFLDQLKREDQIIEPRRGIYQIWK